MHQVLLCVTQQHDLWVVALAAVICTLGCYSAVALGRHTLRCRETAQRLQWAAAAVLATSTAIWATHFIAMLAFHPSMTSGFVLATTVESFVIAVLMVAGGFGIVLAWPSLAGRATGGLMIGLAISAMHYTGMSAYRVQGSLAWDGAEVLVSVVLGALFGSLAMILAFNRRALAHQLAPGCLLLAVCGTHFVGMAAVSMTFDPQVEVPAGSITSGILVVLTANAALVVLLLSLAALKLQTVKHQRLDAEDQRLRDFADIAVEGLVICENNTVSGINRSLEHMLGTTRDTVLGSAIQRLLPHIILSAVPAEQEIDTVLHGDGGNLVPVRVIARAITINAKPHTVIAVRDQRDRLRAEHEMHHLAHHDALTGLANRRQFNNALAGRFLARRASNDAPFAVLTLDLDRFKTVNDTLGHAIGDELLRRVAKRIGRVVREEDTVSRLGGDEFAILKAGAADLASLQVMTERLIDVIGRPFLIDSHIINVGTSIGIALAPNNGDTPDELLRNADLALYGAKTEGRGRYRLFEAGMNARVQARRSLELDLRRALNRQEFELYFQPLVNSNTGQFDGAEALVRWHHPERGMVSPAEFIPLAEETGLICQLGEWVLRAACTEAMRWPGDMPVAVNVSPVQFRSTRLSAVVRNILADTQLPPERLEIEITEGALLQQEERTLTALHELRALGVRISMDDFGTGYSSLSYLRRFPFDKIKIDQSFVRQTPLDKDSAAIVRAIATLGNSLGMKTTAEGVETSAQANFIVNEGCDQLQGYLYSRPVPADTVAELFARHVPAPA